MRLLASIQLSVSLRLSFAPTTSPYHCLFSQAALTTLDQKVLSKIKHLNALKHSTQTQQRRLEELQLEYQRMKPEASGGAQSPDACTRKKEEDAMVVLTYAHVEMCKNVDGFLFFLVFFFLFFLLMH